MDIILIAGGAGLFAAGVGLGGALALALARDKIAAIKEAAERANAQIAAQSEGALRALADAHQKAEGMIGAFETAKDSTARAEKSVASLMAEIAAARADLDDVSRRGWFGARARKERLAALESEPAAAE